MKKLVALGLLLVLLLSLCVSAFADTFPTAVFASDSKNQFVKYGKNARFTLHLNCGSYKRVVSTTGSWIYRAGFVVNVQKNGDQSKALDYDYTGSGTKTYKFRPRDLSVVTRPEIATKYKLLLGSYYRPTAGFTVYSWVKCGEKKTYMWVY